MRSQFPFRLVGQSPALSALHIALLCKWPDGPYGCGGKHGRKFKHAKQGFTVPRGTKPAYSSTLSCRVAIVKTYLG
jgi:hypothetical protein